MSNILPFPKSVRVSTYSRTRKYIRCLLAEIELAKTAGTATPAQKAVWLTLLMINDRLDQDEGDANAQA